MVEEKESLEEKHHLDDKPQIEDGLDYSILEKTIKNRLDYGDKVSNVRLDLARKGYKLARVDSVIKKYSKEDTKKEGPNDKLVKEIEFGLFNGESMQEVIKKLHHKGHTKAEFEKAIPLVNVKTKIELAKMMQNWDHYFIILQAWILVATILLGVFYNKVFIIASFIMTGQIIIEYFQIKRRRQIKDETTKLPFENGFDIDLLLKEENLQEQKIGRIKAFFKGIIESHYLISIFFLLFGIGFGITFGLVFFTICAVLSLVSFVSFWRPFKY